MLRDKNEVTQLTCEYLTAPLGIQNPAPRFGWKVVGNYCRTTQEAYHIQVYNQHSGECVWDSGKVFSDRCTAIEYEGKPLESFLRYRWQVVLWLCEIQDDGNGLPCRAGDRPNLEKEPVLREEDREGRAEAFQIQAEDTFEMGILSPEEWKGSWICAKEMASGAVPLFRREFTVEKLPERARVYLCGLGYCEAWINGRKLGDAFLDPGWTNYNKVVLYRVYDATEFLREGKNVFSAELGGGWLTLDHEAFEVLIGRHPAWTSEPKMLCNIYLDGQCIATEADAAWMYADGPVRAQNLYDGEYYDASGEKKGYRLPSYQPIKEEWKEAAAAGSPAGCLQSQIMPPIRMVREREPKYIEYIGEKENFSVVVDFGVNFSGWIRLTASGEKGRKLRILYGETLNPDHSVNQLNLRMAKGEDILALGEGKTVYFPRFAYHGFRYVQIVMGENIVLEEVTGCEVHTDVKRAGTFSCSDKMLNRIQKTVCHTELNNLHSVPTDCPQRDERLGWLNDMTVRFEEGLYNFDMLLFYEKWLQDIAVEQREDGAIPDTAPYFFGENPACHISSVYLLLPWMLYLFYEDRQILKRHYDGFKKYLLFKLGERDGNGLLPEKYLGDWAPPMTEAYLGIGENSIPKNLTHSFMTTCFLYYDCKTMEKIGTVLGKKEDVRMYGQEAEKVKADLNRSFLKAEGYYDTGAQGCNLFALFLGVVPKDQKKQVLEHLLKDLVEKRKYHVTTGNQMTKFLYEMLNQEGLDGTAYRVAAADTYPSIGFMLKNGATTIWERWENLTGNHMNSHNHPMLGAFTVWFYKGLAGIRLDEAGNRRLRLRPAVIAELDFAEASHEFCWGTCSAKWERKGQEVVYSFEIPWGMTAVLDLSNCTCSCERILCNDAEVSKEELKGRIFKSGAYQIRLL